MVVAQSQIYTLSPIDEWMVQYDDKKELIPKEERVKYISTSYDFGKWVQISDNDFHRVAEEMAQRGSKIFLKYTEPFYFRESVFSGPRENCFVYLVDGSLVTFVSEEEDYNVNPESTHFREEKLLDHVNIMLSSGNREGLEIVASELSLPLFEMVSQE